MQLANQQAEEREQKVSVWRPCPGKDVLVNDGKYVAASLIAWLKSYPRPRYTYTRFRAEPSLI